MLQEGTWRSNQVINFGGFFDLPMYWDISIPQLLDNYKYVHVYIYISKHVQWRVDSPLFTLGTGYKNFAAIYTS